MSSSDVVITGIGVVSPIGTGRQEFWRSLCEGRSGVRPLGLFDVSSLPVRIAAEVRDFNPLLHVRNRKQLKVMCRDAQLGVAAAALACGEAGLTPDTVAPERLGVVLGADRICSPIGESESAYRPCVIGGQFDFARWATVGMAASFPLGFLRVLPNMIASHISIAHDARGPNNTIHAAEVSGLLALGEAAAVIQRGSADMMIAGGASSQLTPLDCVRRCAMGILSARQDDPAAVLRPFEAARDGQVWGEGAAILVLESRRHAEARGAAILGRLLSWASAYAPPARGQAPQAGSLRQVIQLAIKRAGVNGRGLGHVNAHGLSTATDDCLEAHALAETVPHVPVTAPKSYFGNLGAAGGVMELAASVLSFSAGVVPPTLNYERPDPACPIEVIHGQPMACSDRPALSLNWTPAGQAVGVVVGGPD